MNHSFNHFDKTFVISARNNQERREYIKRILGELDINFEFYDAIIGKDMSEEEISAVYDEEKAIRHKTIKRPLSKPEIGCTLSHMNIYKKILEEELNHALIFEDDIDPVFKNLPLAEEAIKELPDDWDLLYFGTLNHDVKAPLSFKLKLFFYYPFLTTFFPSKIDYEYRNLWNIYPRNYSKSLRYAGHHQGLQAYAMSHSGAKKFFNYHDKIVTAPDYMPSIMIIEGILNAFITKKNLFKQNRKFESALEASRLQIKETRKN